MNYFFFEDCVCNILEIKKKLYLCEHILSCELVDIGQKVSEVFCPFSMEFAGEIACIEYSDRD